jgi:hypothetical protein
LAILRTHHSCSYSSLSLSSHTPVLLRTEVVSARQSQSQSAYHKGVISLANVQEGQQIHTQFSQLRNEEDIADRAMKTTFKRNVKGFSFVSVSA